MSNAKLNIFGRAVPAWILGAALVAATAGAAVGTVLAGNVQGNLPTTVSQGLIADTPTATAAGGSYSNDQSFVSVSDDGTRFTAAIELNTGDMWRVEVPLTNESDNDMVVELTIDFPLGITVDIPDNDGLGDSSDATGVGNITRTGLHTWKLDLDSAATGTDKVGIEIAHRDDAPPGFYQIQATFQQVRF